MKKPLFLSGLEILPVFKFPLYRRTSVAAPSEAHTTAPTGASPI